MLQEYFIYWSVKMVCKQLQHLSLKLAGPLWGRSVYFLVLTKTRKYQSSSFNSSWLKLFIELHIATTVTPWISLKVSPPFFCSSEWTLNSTNFSQFLWMSLRDQLKRNPISKNKTFQRKTGNKVDIQETTCDSWTILCFAPLFTSLHSSVLLQIRAGQTTVLLLATKNHLGE